MFFIINSTNFINACVKICRECFYEVFEEEIHRVIVNNQLFKPGERIAIGASGGKGHHFLLTSFQNLDLHLSLYRKFNSLVLNFTSYCTQLEKV